MSASRLKEELMTSIPVRIDYSFEKAYAEFMQMHPKFDDDLSMQCLKQWRDAFELAVQNKLEEASLKFESLANDYSAFSRCALFNIAMCHLMEGRIADAAVNFKRAEAIATDDDYWLHIYSGITCFTLGLIVRANQHWWIATRIRDEEFGQNLLKRFFTYDYHPERMALHPLCLGNGVDVGCGYCKTHPDAIGVDLVVKGERLTTARNVMDRTSQADIVCSGDDLNMFDDNSLDYVVQRHNLEHYQDPIKALQEWVRVLKPGGILGMVVPDDEFCDSIHLDKTHKHVFTRSSLRRIFDLLPTIKVVHMGTALHHWSFVCVAQKVDEGQSASFDYQACIKAREMDEIQRHIDLYMQNGLPGLESQCLRYQGLSLTQTADTGGRSIAAVVS